MVHQRSAESGTLALTAGQLLNAAVETMAKASAVGEFLKTSAGGGATDAGSYRGDETVLLEREIGDQIVELEDETDFVAQ
jgi:hypothetical protein